MAATGPEVRAVSSGGLASTAQARNIALCSQLQEVHRWVGVGAQVGGCGCVVRVLWGGRGGRMHRVSCSDATPVVGTLRKLDLSCCRSASVGP